MSNNVDGKIMATAEDAIQAKYAAVQSGYYNDDFLEPFYNSTVTRRRHVQPIIKRGTHARVCCMDRAIAAFSHSHNSAARLQIVVVGSGKDSSYFRYCNGSIMGLDLPSSPPCDWYEVDHIRVIREKAAIIKESPILSPHCPLEKSSHGFVSTHPEKKHNHRMVEHDLRDDPENLIKKLQLEKEVPTLFLLECVLMYLPDGDSEWLLNALCTSVTQAWVVCYEPILDDDAFGNIMQQNLVAAGVATPDSCLLRTRTLDNQLEKLVVSAGFSRAVGTDMWSAYQTIVTSEQRLHANKCEFLDEIEEWILIMRHYCFLAATTAQAENDFDGITSVGMGSPLGFLPNSCRVEVSTPSE